MKIDIDKKTYIKDTAELLEIIDINGFVHYKGKKLKTKSKIGKLCAIKIAEAHMKTLLLTTLFLSLALAGYAENVDISAIINIESSGNPNVYNKASGCIGLMQINPKGALADWNIYYCSTTLGLDFRSTECINCQVATQHNIGDLYNPSINTKIGTWYINTRIPQLLKHYGIKDCIDYRLLAYNWGIGNLNKHLENPHKFGIPLESINYIKKYRRLTKE